MAEQPGGSAADVADDFLTGGGLPDGASPHEHDGDGVSSSVREFEYRGHRARIETTYRITIDGRPLRGRVEVLPSGAVHYHPFPQYAPASAVDVVHAVIDTVWDRPPVADELADRDPDVQPPPHGHGPGPGHGGEHGHADPERQAKREGRG